MIAAIRAFLGAFGLLIVAISSLVGWNVWTYHRLSDEISVASIGFTKEGPKRFLAIITSEGQPTRQLTLEGDEWQLDARLITWKPWARLLGAAPMYRLDRLSGRYRDIEQARSRPVSAHALTINPGIDLWAFARDGGDWVPGVDAAYGTAVFLPMADGAKYRVTLSSHGLVARPYNQAATTVISTWY